jgi:SAM-dependent methyltransferase
MQDHHVARVAALFEQVASESDQHVAFFSAYGEKLVDWTDVGAGELVLDIGTGRGAVATASRRRGARVVGLDIAAEMLRRGSGPRIRGDARDLPLRGAQLDVAVGAFSIHLLPDPVAGMREAARVTRRGGRVVVALGGRFASPEWDFWFEVLGRHAHRGTLEPSLPAPVAIPDAAAALRAAGLVDVRTSEVEVSVPVSEPRDFLLGEQAHGARSLFDRFDAEVRAQVEAELLGHLNALHLDGGITLRRAATFAEGRVP